MGGRRTVLGALGALAIALAGLAVLRPALLLEADPIAGAVEQFSEAETRDLLLAASVLIGLYVAWAARSATTERVLASDTDATDRFDGMCDAPPELVTAEAQRLSAHDLDRTVTFATAGDGTSLEQVRSRLRTLAAARLARAVDGSTDRPRAERPAGQRGYSGAPGSGPGHDKSARPPDGATGDGPEVPTEEPAASGAAEPASRSTEPASGAAEPANGLAETGPSNSADGTAVERRIAAGTWTDDRTAAAFLSDEEGPSQSLFSRLRLWLDPEAERERRIRRTVTAIESLGGATR